MFNLSLRFHPIIYLFAGTQLISSTLHGQVVADGATSTLSNVTNSLVGDVVVGTNGSFTLLVLSDGALLTNSGLGVISRFSTAISNEVRLISPTARWMMNGNLQVGSNGSTARLVVSNGAFVRNNQAIIGNLAASGSNQALVTGSGSVWSNASDLTVGFVGNGNQMVVSNGASVTSAGGFIGRNGGNNLALVSGSGSVWSNRLDLSIGIFGGGSTNNGLMVESGGRVFSQNGIVGGGAGSTNNFAILTGAGSIWSNQLNLSIGSTLGNQRLIVSNGAALYNDNGTVGGGSSSANDNLAVISGVGSTWNNREDLNLGFFGSNNRLELRSGGTLVSSNGYLALAAIATNNLALVTGAGTSWSNQADLVAGDLGIGTQLVVSNGASVSVGGNAVISRATGAAANSAWITDAGTRWLIASNLFVGSNGLSGLLVVSNGGWVDDLNGTVGYSLASSNNQVLVTGAGSVWSNRADLNIGFNGANNRLTVTNGGLVFARNNVVLGVNPVATNNMFLLDGGTVRVSNAGGTARFDVGRGTATFNSGLMDVDQFIHTNAESGGVFLFNGGTLITRGATIRQPAGHDVLVGFPSHSPAIWDVRPGATNTYLGSILSIGQANAFNQLLITNGGVLTNSEDVHMGVVSTAVSNSILVSGPASRWGIASNNYLAVGSFGSFNRLTISNGAVVTGGSVVVGTQPSASNNVVWVTDPGTTWKNAHDCRFLDGTGNMLVVSNGAWVTFDNIALLSSNSRVVIEGGTLQATNLALTSALTVFAGTNVLNNGLVDVSRLLVTNTAGQFEFNSGTLKTAGTICNNGRMFYVGNGVAPATCVLQGGIHSFGIGLAVLNGAALVGNGTIIGSLLISSGGSFTPGDSLGTLVLSNTPNLGGTLVMKVLKTGPNLSNDLVQVAAPIFYGGTLSVTNSGTTALSVGDSFKLFNASLYQSSFSQMNLPPLTPGLAWMNKLSVDGSIAVVAISQPAFSDIAISGTNVIVSGSNGPAGQTYAVLTATNVSAPAASWQSLVTNQFDAGGQFTFTNALNRDEAQRFFRLRTP